MTDERSMILKMLSEGKISVEEADALLDVLNDTREEEEAAGFSAASAAEDGDRRDSHEHSGKTDDKRSEKKRGFRIDLDLDGLTGSLRETMGSVHETMKGVGATIREAFDGLEGVDIGAEIFRAMGRNRHESERRLTVPVEGAVSLTVANKWGDMRVTGADVDEVDVVARIATWAGDAEQAKTDAEQIELEINRDGDHLVLESRAGTKHGSRIDYEITVPHSLDVTVTTASGDLWLEDLSGSQTANTLSGDINVANLGSDSDDVQVVQTKSGDVLAAALTGEVTLSTLSGDVTIDGFVGTLEISTQSGDIRVKSGKGTLRLKSLSGDITATADEIGEEVSLTTVSGDVNLDVPGTAAFDLLVKTQSGEISIGLDLEEEERQKHGVSGKRNAGGPPVKVSSVSGDVGITGA